MGPFFNFILFLNQAYLVNNRIITVYFTNAEELPQNIYFGEKGRAGRKRTVPPVTWIVKLMTSCILLDTLFCYSLFYWTE